tara:strand:- start:13312 stop:14907 length:1596 start_codon:yes stop_codon:yes gene_type:complete
LVIFIYIVALLFSFSYPQSEIDINHLQLLDYDSIHLNLESRRATVFLIDKFYPNITNDINYLNFKIDGSMMYPLYNSIPREVFLSSSDTTTMSQISFLQDHSEYFYDTSIALKSYLRNNVNLLTQIESKSRKRYGYDEVNSGSASKGVNYDQKALFSIYKNNANSSIDAGYMYHYETIPTYVSALDYPNSPFFRAVESYSFKLYYRYLLDKLNFSNNFNSQTSDYLRPLNFENIESVEYLSQIYWNQMSIDYFIKNNYTLNFQSDYKFIKSDVPDDLFNLNNQYCKNSLGVTFIHNKHQFSFGIDSFKNSIEYYYNYLLEFNKVNFFISFDNNAYMNMQYVDSDKYLMDKSITINKSTGVVFDNQIISSSFVLGSYHVRDYEYFYYKLNANIDYKWISFDMSYNAYESDKLFINHYLDIVFKISPEINQKRYRPYALIKLSDISINDNYNINHSHLNIYSQATVLDEQDFSSINIVDFEIGVLFKYFKIGFIYENYYNKPFVYGYDNDNAQYFLIRNQSDYLIEITWIFKD